MAFDGDRWEELLEKFRALLRFIARRSLNPRYRRQVDPSDMVQKTFLEAHEKRADFRGSSEAELEAWLKAILRFRIIDEIRKVRDLRNDPGDERADEQVRSWTSPLSALVRQEDVLRLVEALEKLDDDERQVVEFIYFDKLTLAETGTLLERSRHAVVRLLRRALARLLDFLR